MRRLRDLSATWGLLSVLLAQAAAGRRVAELERQRVDAARRVERARVEYAETERAYQNASQALIAVKVQLEQSDVVRRRGELERLISAARDSVGRITAERARLFRELAAVSATLRLLLDAPTLADDERARLVTLTETVAPIDPAAPPPGDLAATVGAAIGSLDAAVERVRQEVFEADRKARELRDRRVEVARQLERLRQGRHSARNPPPCAPAGS